MIQMSKTCGRIKIDVSAYRMGTDLCVLITGGDTPHLGALTAASQSTEPKTIAFDTHKEYFVTEMAVGYLRQVLDGNVVVCCGIHLDQIEKQEISVVMEMTEMLIGELCARLRNETGE